MIYGIVLAAGKGKRMKSSLPKVLHRVLGKPMIERVIDAVTGSGAEEVVVVASPDDRVRSFIEEKFPGVKIAIQDEPLGTGDAVRRALPFLEREGYSLITPGDVPMLEGSSLAKVVEYGRDYDLLIVSMVLDDPYGYGRIVRDADGNVVAIVEEKDADEDIKKIREVNTGVYLFRNEILFEYIDRLDNRNAQGEYYITDLVRLAIENGYRVGAMVDPDPDQFRGINSRKQLVEVERIFVERIVEKWLEEGVTIHFPHSVYIEPEVTIGRDTEIFAGVHLAGKTRIGEGCVIQSGVRIENSTVGENVVIKDNSYIEDSMIGNDCKIGPMAHLRPGSVLADRVSIGNFVETKKATIGRGTKINHLSYIGDAEIGEDVNIGAGTITCNYDGFFKYRTIIGDRVFVGSDTQLVAPVKIENDVYIGAGSTITRDVPEGVLALTRVSQTHVEGYTYKKRKKMEELKKKGGS